MKTNENISDTGIFVKSNEMLTVDCCCWGDKNCIDNIEIFEITEKNNTGLSIFCEIAVENADSTDANVDSGINVDSNANVDSSVDSTDDWTCWIDDGLIFCTGWGVWTFCIDEI